VFTGGIRAGLKVETASSWNKSRGATPDRPSFEPMCLSFAGMPTILYRVAPLLLKTPFRRHPAETDPGMPPTIAELFPGGERIPMSFVPDNSRLHREIFQSREEELKRIAEQYAKTHPEDADCERGHPRRWCTTSIHIDMRPRRSN
jgi:hypothetical protein